MENNGQKDAPITDGLTSKELLDHFLVHHHFQWWGEPIQMTTYSTLKNDIHKRIVKIIDRAIQEFKEDSESKFSYREPKYKEEWEWVKGR